MWPPENSRLSNGSVVPVYFRSNITQTYAVGVPETGDKLELELWRVELYPTRRKAEVAVAAYGELMPMFGVATRDGLLMREKPENLAEQVYRFRLGQPVKLLEKVDGQRVETGGQELDGNWYLAMAGDGTKGYVFSNQLELWDSSAGPMPDLRPEARASDTTLATLYDVTWRPDYFNTMAAANRFDLQTYQPRYGLFADPMRRQIRVERPTFSKFYNFERIDRDEDGTYHIVPGDATFYFTKSGTLVFVPVEADVDPLLVAKTKEEQGDDAVVSFTFVRHDRDVQAEVAAEERRRLSRLIAFVAGGERFESEMYGVLIMTRSTRFTWVSYGSLVPLVIPDKAGETGSISMDLYLSESLAASWGGAFSLRFDGEGMPVVRFAYRFDDDDLTLAAIPETLITDAVVDAPDGLTNTATFRRYR